MNSMSALTKAALTRDQSIFEWISDHWFATFLILYGIWVWLPCLAPVFMKLGLTSVGNALYFIYSFFCHQLPERSLFFFGEKTMYSLSEIQAVWQDTANPLILRKFVGNPTMGWKMAWSDRMISFYTSVCLVGIWIVSAPDDPRRRFPYDQRPGGNRIGIPRYQSMAGRSYKPFSTCIILSRRCSWFVQFLGAFPFRSFCRPWHCLDCISSCVPVTSCARWLCNRWAFFL